MSKTLESPSSSAKAPVRSSGWAWLALSASLVLYPLAIVVAVASPDDWLANLISTALVVLPPIACVLLGVRAGRSGNRLGGLATAIGSAWLTFIVAFFVGANYLWSGESLFAPILFAVVLAAMVGGAVEATWYRLGNTPHHVA